MTSTRSKPSWSAAGPRRAIPSIERVRAEKSRRRLADFFRYGWHVLEENTPLDWNWHIDAVMDHLQAVITDWRKKKLAPEEVEQRIQNLLINIPPGTGKSRMVSVYLLPWVWLEVPEWSAIFLSSNPRVALRDAMYCQQVIQSEWYQESFRPEWKFDHRRNGLGLFYNTERGFRSALGFTARITGDRADAIIVDDPHDAEEANSDLVRQSVLDRWDTALGNRVNDLRSSVRIGIMQRLHEADWSGHVLAGGGWEHLCIPMEYEAKRACKCDSCQRGETAIGWTDPRTAEGEVLDPVRFTDKVLATEHTRLGSYGYAGQMQQRPAPAEGGILKKEYWRYYHELPYRGELTDWLISADLSFKGKQDSDRCAFHVWTRRGAERYLVDKRVGRWGFTKAVQEFEALCRAYPQATLKLVEDKANGPALIDVLHQTIHGLVAVEPDGDKVARAWSVQPVCEAGNVWLPSPTDHAGNPILARAWVEDTVQELAGFPTATNDDEVDAFTQANRRYNQMPLQEAGGYRTRAR